MIKPSDYKTKIVVGIPFSGRYVPPEFAMALASFIWPMNIRYSYVACKGLPRENARKEIVANARKLKSQYVCMLDDDVVPPSDVFQKLSYQLDMQPEFDYIAGVVPSRSTPSEPMIFMNEEMGAYWHWRTGDVFEVSEAATACMMFRTSIFDSIPEPWFMDLNTIEERTAAGEKIDENVNRGAMTDDIYFCRKAKKYGHRLLAHGGVICQHYGRHSEVFELDPGSYPLQKEGCNITEALKIDGWMQPRELRWLAEHASTKTNILEVGSFLGRSTRALAENTKGKVVAVDTWNISDIPKGSRNEAIESLDNKPVDYIYDQFRTNMLGLDNVHVIRMKSTDAAKTIPDDLKFDMIFIDADHTYEGCKADIETWKPKLKDGGMICGHDYSWEGVGKALSELLPSAERAQGDLWYVPV
jgi:hypothetical protein